MSAGAGFSLDARFSACLVAVRSEANGRTLHLLLLPGATHVAMKEAAFSRAICNTHPGTRRLWSAARFGSSIRFCAMCNQKASEKERQDIRRIFANDLLR